MQLKLETTEEQLVDALRLNTRLLAELSARYAGEEMPERPDDMQTIQCSDDVARVVGDMRDLMQEQLRVLVLNNRHAVLEQRVIYQGTVNSCSIRVAEILRPAIVANAPAIVIVHNHPSGDPTPSPGRHPGDAPHRTERATDGHRTAGPHRARRVVAHEHEEHGAGLLDLIQQARASG